MKITTLTQLLFALAICAGGVARADVFNMPAGQTSASFATVGNPGNPHDSSGWGSVNYSFGVDKYDVTNAQYVQFLNAKDPTGADPLDLYDRSVATDTVYDYYGGIRYIDSQPDGSKYSVVPGDANHPVIYVTFFDAVRFANWVNNGQGNGDTETGAYTLLGGTPFPSNAFSVMRNSDASVFLPSESELDKADYYNPATGTYYNYPTSSNTVPQASYPPNSQLANTANYGGVVQFPPNSLLGTLSDVGAYANTTSPYGLYDTAGDVMQYTDTMFAGTHYRAVRGIGWDVSAPTGPLVLPNSIWNLSDPPSDIFVDTGFRLAAAAGVPEPSALLLLGVGAGGLLWRVGRQLPRAGGEETGTGPVM